MNVTKSIEIKDLVDQFQLEVLTGGELLSKKVTKDHVRRPGLEFIKFLPFFPQHRVYVLGDNELQYLYTLTEEEREERIGNLVKYQPPCIIVTDGVEGLKYLPRYCEARGIPLLRTEEINYEFIKKIDTYLIRQLAPEIAVHGVCLNIFGVGVLLRGASGIGKSETAHSLIGRGHRLVADDIVVLKKISPQTLLGTHNETNKELLSMRSIGLVNVVRMYGASSFQEETRIAIDIELTKWDDRELYNEIEVKSQYSTYMDIEIPYFQIQLKPGRDVVGLIEATVNNWYLKQQGYSAADDFMKRLDNDLT